MTRLAARTLAHVVLNALAWDCRALVPSLQARYLPTPSLPTSSSAASYSASSAFASDTTTIAAAATTTTTSPPSHDSRRQRIETTTTPASQGLLDTRELLGVLAHLVATADAREPTPTSTSTTRSLRPQTIRLALRALAHATHTLPPSSRVRRADDDDDAPALRARERSERREQEEREGLLLARQACAIYLAARVARYDLDDGDPAALVVVVPSQERTEPTDVEEKEEEPVLWTVTRLAASLLHPTAASLAQEQDATGNDHDLVLAATLLRWTLEQKHPRRRRLDTLTSCIRRVVLTAAVTQAGSRTSAGPWRQLARGLLASASAPTTTTTTTTSSDLLASHERLLLRALVRHLAQSQNDDDERRSVREAVERFFARAAAAPSLGRALRELRRPRHQQQQQQQQQHASTDTATKQLVLLLHAASVLDLDPLFVARVCRLAASDAATSAIVRLARRLARSARHGEVVAYATRVAIALSQPLTAAQERALASSISDATAAVSHGGGGAQLAQALDELARHTHEMGQLERALLRTLARSLKSARAQIRTLSLDDRDPAKRATRTALQARSRTVARLVFGALERRVSQATWAASLDAHALSQVLHAAAVASRDDARALLRLVGALHRLMGQDRWAQVANSATVNVLVRAASLGKDDAVLQFATGRSQDGTSSDEDRTLPTVLLHLAATSTFDERIIHDLLPELSARDTEAPPPARAPHVYVTALQYCVDAGMLGLAERLFRLARWASRRSQETPTPWRLPPHAFVLMLRGWASLVGTHVRADRPAVGWGRRALRETAKQELWDARQDTADALVERRVAASTAALKNKDAVWRVILYELEVGCDAHERTAMRDALASVHAQSSLRRIVKHAPPPPGTLERLLQH